ncbi:MAG: [FeFe] hydrogenase H-cluster radical SAM maturase HydE [Armatimonadota bacterium]
MLNFDPAQSLQRVLADSYSVDDLEFLLETDDPAQEAALFEAANRVREEAMGPGVHLRALIEFSNHCSGGCEYCGLRAKNSDLQRYRMEPDEIVAAARKALELGYKTVVLQSGEDRWFSREIVAALVRRIKALGDIAVTLCLGERPREDYAAWKEAGTDRYLVRIESSNRALYERLHPGMSFDNRLRCLRDLRELGYQVGSGVLVGLPEQTTRMLAQDLLFLRDLKADMVGMGPFIPHEQTPLAQVSQGSVDTVLRMMALTRLLLPQSYVVSTTALGTLDAQGRERGLQAGGNVMMPNCTPRKYRAMYEIYPNKICVDEEPEQCRGCLTGRIRSIGREIAEDQGNAPWTQS